MKTGVVLSLIVIFSLAGLRASAQFNVNTTANTENQPTVEINLKTETPTTVEMTNAAKELALRKLKWREHNLVDTKITLTGTATQFNKSWATNNQNSVSALIVAYYYHTYTKDRFTCQFKFDGQYGLNYLEDAWFKNQDQLKFYYLASWKIKDKGWGRDWAYSFSTQFNTQFAEGLKSRTDHQVWSNFMAPANLNAGLGITYTSPDKKWPFVVTLSPFSGNVLFVMDNRLSDERKKNLGLIPTYAPDDTNKEHPLFTKNFKAEGGSNLNVSFDQTYKIGKNKGLSIRYRSTFGSFYGWITQISKRNIDSSSSVIMPTVNWSNTINFDPLKFLTFQFTHTMVYDKSQVNKVQMQYFLSIGLTYGYKNK
jgi:hypothetical protein